MQEKKYQQMLLIPGCVSYVNSSFYEFLSYGGIFYLKETSMN